MQNRQTAEFAIQTNTKGTVERVGRSTILQPKTYYKGNGIKWFDDTKLIKKDSQEVTA